MENIIKEMISEIKERITNTIDSINTFTDLSEILVDVNTYIDAIKELILVENKDTSDLDDNKNISKLYLEHFNGIFDIFCDLYDKCRDFYVTDPFLFEVSMTTKRRCTACGMFINAERIFFMNIIGLQKNNIILLYLYNNPELSSQECCISIIDQIFSKYDNSREGVGKRSNIMRTPNDRRYIPDTFERISSASPGVFVERPDLIQNDIPMESAPYSSDIGLIIQNIYHNYTLPDQMVTNIHDLMKVAEELGQHREHIPMVKIINKLKSLIKSTKNFVIGEDSDIERSYRKELNNIFIDLKQYVANMET